MRRLHVGVTPWLAPIGGRADRLTRQAMLAESLGYESFWLPENHFSGDAAIPDPLMLLAAVSGATTDIRLGTTSFLLPLRHPLQAAEQVAVLDQLSGGRVILGVGRGYQESMFAAFNVERREKREIFEWCLGTMIAAWRGDPVTTNDPTEVRLAPRPVQQPHPPIWVAAFGPKALTQAGRLGLPYLASPMETLAVLKDNYLRHRDACAACGRTLPPEVPVMRSVFVSEDRSQVAGVRELLEKQTREARATGPAHVRHRASDDVGAWALVGDRAEVADGVARYVEELGVTHLVATRLRIGGVPGDVLERSVRSFAELLESR
jgi:alkanesulfonate monooxygenase SsuD/methylene tetrahydromethanopterin reductase-like flavin-dependent oxidoreductase (luciferase family)